MSGGTRCNVTHDVITAADYHGGSRHVVARLLREFSHEDTVRFFAELGVELKREETGKLFPVTDDANTVLDALVRECTARGVRILTGRKVVAIERAAGGAGFLLTTAAGETHTARAVILTTGGLSYPRTGSDGTGYQLAQALGHSLTPTSPALTPLEASGDLHARLRGVTLPVELTVVVAGKRFWRGTGSFLFTHFGYSGPVALDASRHVVREGWHAPVEVHANFLPGETPEACDASLLAEAAHEPRRSLLGTLRTRLPERLSEELLSEVGVPAERALAQLTRDERRRLVRALTAFVLPVTRVMGYRKAEVTAGGVPLAEVDPSTLESRCAPGLYLAGEILDVEGRLGGYNFQFAWSTGWVAGRGAARSTGGTTTTLPA
jgi:hypothetical protein